VRYSVIGLAVSLLVTGATVTAALCWGGHGLEVASWVAGIASFLLGAIALLDAGGTRSRASGQPTASPTRYHTHIEGSRIFTVGDHNTIKQGSDQLESDDA
jgi:hypothetical protein